MNLLFLEFIVEDGRVYLATESTEEEEETEDEEVTSISQSDSGTDVSEVGMFGVPKPQTTVQKGSKSTHLVENHATMLPMADNYRQAREVVFIDLQKAHSKCSFSTMPSKS